MKSACVLVVGDVPAEHRGWLLERELDIHFEAAPDDHAPAAMLAWAQNRAAIAAALARHPTIRWVHFRRVGLVPAVVRLFDDLPAITVTTGSGASGPALAEHVLALTLALYKRLPELARRQRERQWPRNFELAELRGATVCIVGLGDIGRSTARVLRPLGVRLLGVRRQPGSVAEVDETHQPPALLDLLRRSQVLVLAAPLVPETFHLIGAPELAALPAGAFVINVGRGDLIDEAALIAALASGHLGGAGLDVVSTEPLPAESPLWMLPNVLVTPHAASHTGPTERRTVDVFLDNLGRFRTGAPLRNVVDRQAGY